jgi:hypothetical protein
LSIIGASTQVKLRWVGRRPAPRLEYPDLKRAVPDQYAWLKRDVVLFEDGASGPN